MLTYVLLITIAIAAVHAQDEVCNTVESADIILVLDSSGSVGAANWVKQLDFAKDLVNGFNIGPQNVQIGLVCYGTYARVGFQLNTYTDKADVLAFIENIPFKSEWTNTSGGIRLMSRDMFNVANGDRPGVPNIGIVITDGESNKDGHLTIPEADNARAAGIIMFAIGIGSGVNQVELEGIGNDPDSEFVFNADSFDALPAIAEAVVTETCEASNDPPPCDPTAAGHLLTCEWKYARFAWDACDNGLVRIARARWGRDGDNSTCVDQVPWIVLQDLDCSPDEDQDDAASAAVTAWCNDPSHIRSNGDCKIRAANPKVGGDPCVGTFKYLRTCTYCGKP